MTMLLCRLKKLPVASLLMCGKKCLEVVVGKDTSVIPRTLGRFEVPLFIYNKLMDIYDTTE